MSKDITICMPVFNGETFIKEALESITNQDCKDFNVLIYDDGSYDNTKKIVNQSVIIVVLQYFSVCLDGLMV